MENANIITHQGKIKCMHCLSENNNTDAYCKYCGKPLHLYNVKGDLIDVSPEFANNIEEILKIFPEYSKKITFLNNDDTKIEKLKEYFIAGQRDKIFTLIHEYYNCIENISDIKYSDIVDKKYEDFEELIVFYSSIFSRLILERRSNSSVLMNKKYFETISFILGFSKWIIKLRDNVKNDSYDNYNISLDGNEISYLYFRMNTQVEKVEVSKRLDILQDDEIKKEEVQPRVEEVKKEEKQKRKRPSIITIAACTLLVLIIASVGIYFKFFKVDLEYLKDSVVMVEVYDKYGNELATGSGFCAYRPDYIVTNYHVIEGAYEIKLVTDWDEEFNAKTVEIFNEEADIAILSIDGELTPIKIGNSDTCKIGQKVYAIGSPVGEKNTVSQGTISNLDDVENIRITTPISHGSSGGALLDETGKVVGITYAGYDNAQNLNFAIPVTKLNNLYNAIAAQDYTTLSSSMYKNTIKDYTSLEDEMFEKIIIKEDKNYASSNIKNVYYATSGFSKFDDTLAAWQGELVDKYNNMDSDEKWTVYSYFEKLKEYDYSDSLDDAVKDLSRWDSYDWILNLKLMKRWKLALFINEVNDLDSSNLSETISQYCDTQTQLIIILAANELIDINELDSTYKENVIDYIYALNSTRKTQGKILEKLGFRVEYRDDGAIVTYY